MRFLKYILVATLALPAFAQEGAIEARLHPEIATTPGWNFTFKLGIDNPNFNFSQWVPGVDNSTLVHLGGNATVTAAFLQGAHEWRNKVSLAIAYNLDQFVSDFVKARDYLRYDSTYYFSISEGLWGLFGKFNFDTSMFPGLDIQPADSPTIYKIYNADGTLNTTTAPQTRLTLTGAFSPIVLTENAGLFIRPVTIRPFTWEVLAGANAIQGLTAGKRIITDVSTDDPPVTTVETLENFFQVGIGLGNSFWGVLLDQLTYSGGISVNYAFYDSGSVVDLANTFANNISMDASLGVTYQPLTWLGVSWEGHARYQPYVTTDFQLDSFFNLNFALSM